MLFSVSYPRSPLFGGIFQLLHDGILQETECRDEEPASFSSAGLRAGLLLPVHAHRTLTSDVLRMWSAVSCLHSSPLLFHPIEQYPSSHQLTGERLGSLLLARNPDHLSPFLPLTKQWELLIALAYPSDSASQCKYIVLCWFSKIPDKQCAFSRSVVSSSGWQSISNVTSHLPLIHIKEGHYCPQGKVGCQESDGIFRRPCVQCAVSLGVSPQSGNLQPSA
jgi:hypothetical protein